MTAFIELPDLEAVCSIALRDAGYSAYSSVPRDPVWPLIVVRRIGGIPAARRKLDAAIIDFNVWGGAKGDKQEPQVTKSEIRDLAAAARVELLMLEGVAFHSDDVHAFITAVEDQSGLHWLPDPTSGRDRYIFSMNVWGELLAPLAS